MELAGSQSVVMDMTSKIDEAKRELDRLREEVREAEERADQAQSTLTLTAKRAAEVRGAIDPCTFR